MQTAKPCSAIQRRGNHLTGHRGTGDRSWGTGEPADADRFLIHESNNPKDKPDWGKNRRNPVQMDPLRGLAGPH